MKLSYDALVAAIDAWPTQVALMQLGKSTDVQQALVALPESTLKRAAGRSSGAADAVKATLKDRGDTLNFLYLAQGGNKYESAAVGLRYMGDAKAAAEAAKDDLNTLAQMLGAL